jgi:hypothetical protein
MGKGEAVAKSRELEQQVAAINRSALVASQISISPIFIAGNPSQNPQCSLFHLLGLCGGFVKP